MTYLPLQNKRNLGDEIPDHEFIDAKDKHVIILGGGDTGADCLGTAHPPALQERQAIRASAASSRIAHR